MGDLRRSSNYNDMMRPGITPVKRHERKVRVPKAPKKTTTTDWWKRVFG